jgi:hemerythrin-like domain-containing protein
MYTQPLDKMRPVGVGDWYHQKSGGIKVEVAETGNQDYDFLLMLHEFVESYLCQRHGVKEETVNKYDLESKVANPGAELDSPYKREHSVAEGVERLVAEALGVDWVAYDKHTDELFDERWPAWTNGEGEHEDKETRE